MNKVIGYISEWTMVNFPGCLSQVKLEQLTHLIFASVSTNGSPILYTGWGIEDTANRLDQVVAAGHAKGLKVLFSFYGTASTGLLSIVNSPSLRAALVSKLVDFCVAHNADGIEVNWEEIAAYGQPTDTLISDLYAALTPLGKIVSTSAAWDYISISLSSQAKVSHIDIMTYDMTYYPAAAATPVHSSYGDTLAAVQRWVAAGFDRSKLMLGIPAYGLDKNGMAVLYREIVDAINPTPYQSQTDSNIIARGITFQAPIWWNSPELTKQKSDWAKAQGLGGIMLFDIGEDKTDSQSLLQVVSGSFGVSQVSFKVTLTRVFKDTTPIPVTTRKWNFGDGKSSTVKNPSHTYAKPGAYTVTLTNDGKSVSQTVTVQ